MEIRRHGVVFKGWQCAFVFMMVEIFNIYDVHKKFDRPSITSRHRLEIAGIGGDICGGK